MNYLSDVYSKRYSLGLHQGYWWSMRMAMHWRRCKAMTWYFDRLEEFTSGCVINSTQRKRYSS